MCRCLSFPQMDRLQSMAVTQMVSPVCFPSSIRGRPTTPAPLLDAAMDSCGAPPPQTLRLTKNILSAQRRMVSISVGYYI